MQSLYKGRFIEMVKLGNWEFVQRVNSIGVVIIIAVTNDDNILFVEQFRPPLGKKCIELPAGLAGDKGAESDEVAVRRELAEESGYEAGEIAYLGHGVVTPGLTSENAAMYIARNLKKMENPPKDEGEEIVLHEVPLLKADAWLAAKRAEGLVIDWKVYTGLYFALTVSKPIVVPKQTQ